MKQDLGLDARGVLCCVVCVFGLWHGMEPGASTVGLDSHRRSLMRDKAETEEVCGEQGSSLFLSFAPQRPLSPHSRLSCCAKLPSNTRIISCLHYRQRQGRAVEKGGGQRGYRGGGLRVNSSLRTWGLYACSPTASISMLSSAAESEKTGEHSSTVIAGPMGRQQCATGEPQCTECTASHSSSQESFPTFSLNFLVLGHEFLGFAFQRAVWKSKCFTQMWDCIYKRVGLAKHEIRPIRWMIDMSLITQTSSLAMSNWHIMVQKIEMRKTKT